MEYTVELNTEVVRTLFEMCTAPESEHVEGAIEVEGITGKIQFKPDELERKKDFIEALLDELPDEFHAATGGGWSFLNACVDRRGNQWTDLHLRMDQLFMLGMAVGKVELLLPRDTWHALPGGMPYYVVN